MTSAIDVAQYIYERMGQWIDSWRLQKLTYYSKAWALAWDGDSLFDEQFSAWPDGPVSYELYRVNRHEKVEPTSALLPGADSTHLTPRQQAIVDAVLGFYGDMSKEELIELTHREQPWMEARDGLAADAPGKTLIKDSTMRETYTRQALMIGTTPTAPDGHAPSRFEIDNDAIASQIDKWSDTLDWLTTR